MVDSLVRSAAYVHGLAQARVRRPISVPTTLPLIRQHGRMLPVPVEFVHLLRPCEGRRRPDTRDPRADGIQALRRRSSSRPTPTRRPTLAHNAPSSSPWPVPSAGRLVRLWREMLDTGQVGSIAELARTYDVDRSYVSRVLQLTALAPEIAEAILAGKEPSGLSLAGLRRDSRCFGMSNTIRSATASRAMCRRAPSSCQGQALAYQASSGPLATTAHRGSPRNASCSTRSRQA